MDERTRQAFTLWTQAQPTVSAYIHALVGDRGVRGRIFFGFTVALFAAIACWGVAGNFFHLPLAFMYANMADVVIGWTLASVAIAVVLGRGRGTVPSAA